MSSLLVDTTNTAPPVQLKDQGILVQSDHEESQASEKDEQVRRFEELINKGQYVDIAELGKKLSDKELLKCLCQVVTTLDHFKGLFGYLKQRKMVPGFLAHGDMVLVRKVIVKTDLLEAEYDWECYSIYDAIVLSLKEDRHERVAGLFEAARKKPAWKEEFDRFVRGFFDKYHPEKDSMPLKRFLTLHGKKLRKKHPDTFGTICERLMRRLHWCIGSPDSQQLLTGLVGQSSLLPPAAFASGFLGVETDWAVRIDRTSFIKYGWREAIEEGLKGKYDGGGGSLWEMMVSEYPDQFSGEYPGTGDARRVALKNFKPTKQDREEAWAKENAPIFLSKLVAKLQAPDIFILLSPVPWNIIVEYAETGATWVDV